MRIIIRIFLGIVLTIMFLLTILCCFDIGKHFLAGGSIASTMDFFLPNKWFVIIVYLLIVISIFIFRKRIKLLLPILVILFGVWCFSGRTVGVHWTGQLIYGWFNIETGRMDLVELFDEFGENVLDNIEVRREGAFDVLIKGDGEKTIYLGPFIRQQFIDKFNRKSPMPQE